MTFEQPTDLADGDRMDADGQGDLDDMVITNIDKIHLEYMDHKRIWIRLYRHGRTDIIIHLSSRSRLDATVQLDPNEHVR